MANTLEFVKTKATDTITSAISSGGETLSKQISDRACELLADRIPEITENITNALINKLKQKIDSDKFSKDFVNILQQKLLEENRIAEPFMKKFSVLFDTIIEKAEDEWVQKNKIADAGPVAVRLAELESEPVAEPGQETGQETESVTEPVAESVTGPESVGGKKNSHTPRQKRKRRHTKTNKNKPKLSFK